MSRDVYILLTLGALYVFAAFLPVLFLKMGRLHGALLPELALFKTYRERRCAVRTACTRVPVLAGSVVLTLAMLAVLWVMVGGEFWFSSAPLWLSLTVFCLGPYLVASALFWTFFRTSVRRSLRLQLAERGVPICVRCGYDLRGQVEPRCPECGCAAVCPAQKACEVGRQAPGVATEKPSHALVAPGVASESE